MKGINTKQFKEWIEKNIGKRCEEKEFGCFVCQTWELYDKIIEFEKLIKELED